MLFKFLRLYHTLKYLKPIQFYYRGLNSIKRYLPLPSHGLPPASKLLILSDSVPTYEEYSPVNQFEFLNTKINYNQDINWNDLSQGKLWLYHLCAFNYLGQHSMTKEQGTEIIQSFNNYPNKKDGLEPYPISLRLINIIKFITKHNIKNEKINQSLWSQTKILKNNLEYHLLGNHLLENSFALLFSGVYFNDSKTISKAKNILTEQLKEQILEDGGHFELSPMYHAIILYRVLDAYNLLLHNSDDDHELLEFLKYKASKMLGWLENMTFSNGEFPHFNDCTKGIAPTTKQLIKYAKRLQITTIITPLTDSGYKAIKGNHYELKLDVGNIGPNYIPGHAHNDIFSFELHVDSKPFIVNMGTSTYESSKRRTLERSTYAHNTVQVSDFEQTETWASFRVGRRNHPTIVKEGENEIVGSYQYPSINIQHTRKFSWAENEINITDKIEKSNPAKVLLHFHPDVEIKLNNNQVITSLGTVKFKGALNSHILNYKYAEGFNNLIDAKMVIIEFEENITTTILL